MSELTVAERSAKDEFREARLDLREDRGGAIIGAYRPAYADVRETRLDIGLLDWPSIDLVTFDVERQVIGMRPTRTRPSLSFLKPKYPWLRSLTVEVQGLKAPTTAGEAQEELYRLPEGFIFNWEWGLGVQKINQPIIDSIRRLGGFRSIRLVREDPTQITEAEYRLNIGDYEQLSWDMRRVTRVHQQDGLKERKVVAHNALLADRDPTVRRQATPVRRNALSELLEMSAGSLTISPKDQLAMIRAVGEGAPVIIRREPKAIARLQVELELVTLDALIERFEALLDRPSSEAEWQTLLQTNPFILAMIFGYPVVLQQSQAAVGGPNVTGSGEKIADFLLTHQMTNNCALLEIKKPATALISKRKDRGVPAVAQDLTNAVVQVLDQRQRFQLEFVALKYRSRGADMEPHHVGCVVVAGRMPTDADEVRAFEIYRNAFKDVMVLTFDEVLARLKSLRTHLAPDAADQLAPDPPPPSYSGFMNPPWGPREDNEPLF